MAFLFGDSTPSSLQVDYIELLRDALDFAVQVLTAEERMQKGAARAAELQRDGDAEVARLETLGAELARAVQSADQGKPDSATAECAQKLLKSAAAEVLAAIDGVHKQVAAQVQQLEAEARRDRERCQEALAALLLHHDLPEMTSELRLSAAGGGYQARLRARGLEDLSVLLELDVAASNALAHVVRVDKLVERLEVHAPEAGGWLRKEVKLRPQRLDKEYVTGFVSGGGESTLQLRADPDGKGPGYDLTIVEKPARVSLRRAGESEEQPPFQLEEADAAKVLELAGKLHAQASELGRARKALLEAQLGDTALVELRRPRVLVERLVAKMAPIVQEIIKRSLTQTELVLKRQTGDGRREEIFVSRADLLAKLRPLEDEFRALFAPLALGEPPPREAPPPSREPLFSEALSSEPPKARPSDPSLEIEIAGPSGLRPPPPPKRDDAVKLDDSLERLLVSSDGATHKPE